MKLLKGKKIADNILGDLKKKIKTSQTKPGLAVVLVGKNRASETYVKLKAKAAKKVGIDFQLFRFSERSAEREIIKKIQELNQDKRISGIIVQLPLPEKFHQQRIINIIDPQKDADGFHPKNLKVFLAGQGNIEPVFPQAIIKLLENISAIRIDGKIAEKKLRAVIVANSDNFGKIMRAALERRGIAARYVLAVKLSALTPTLSRRERGIIKDADIVISAVGKPGIIKGAMLKKGAIVIDGGITKKGQKVLGDVDVASVKNIVSYLSPVPGGVGPVTVACLLENVCKLSKKSR